MNHPAVLAVGFVYAPPNRRVHPRWADSGRGMVPLPIPCGPFRAHGPEPAHGIGVMRERD